MDPAASPFDPKDPTREILCSASVTYPSTERGTPCMRCIDGKLVEISPHRFACVRCNARFWTDAGESWISIGGFVLELQIPCPHCNGAHLTYTAARRFACPSCDTRFRRTWGAIVADQQVPRASLIRRRRFTRARASSS